MRRRAVEGRRGSERKRTQALQKIAPFYDSMLFRVPVRRKGPGTTLSAGGVGREWIFGFRVPILKFLNSLTVYEPESMAIA